MIFKFISKNSPKNTQINNARIKNQLVSLTEEGDDSILNKNKKLSKNEKKKPEATPAQMIPSLQICFTITPQIIPTTTDRKIKKYPQNLAVSAEINKKFNNQFEEMNPMMKDSLN